MVYAPSHNLDNFPRAIDLVAEAVAHQDLLELNYSMTFMKCWVVHVAQVLASKVNFLSLNKILWNETIQ